MTRRLGKTERRMRQMLKDTGLPFEMKLGARHWHLYLAGEMIGVLSNGRQGEADRGLKNLEACIKRVMKDYGQERPNTDRPVSGVSEERVSRHRRRSPVAV